MHSPERRALQDTLTAIRHRCTMAAAGHRLFPNGERHLRSYEQLREDLSAGAARGNAAHRAALRVLARRSLRYSYPRELVPQGIERLRASAQPDRSGTASGAGQRAYRTKIRAVVEKELALIKELQYEHFFLTVHEIVEWAREPAETDPVPGPRLGGQFGRLLRPAHHRGRPAQHRRAVRALHQQGAQRAAGHRRRLRARTTRGSHPARVREVRARARGAGRHRHHLSADERDPRRRQGAGARPGRDRSPREIAGVLGQLGALSATASPAQGLHLDADVMQRLCALVKELLNFPRHLSQHVGGFVIARGSGQRPGADRERGDARSHDHSVGQERSGVARPAQGRCAGARHADGHAADVRSARQRPAPARRAWTRFRARIRRPTT